MTNNIPEISIIIPVYNVEQYVEKCILSIKKQSFTNFEAIIVDDGSKDSSIKLCENLIRNDCRFKILHKENGGLMSAWKYGLSNALGKYIGFVDSDDWIDSDMYDRLYNAIVFHQADIVFSGYITEYKTNPKRWTRSKLYIYENDRIKEAFLKEYCCSYFDSMSNPSINRWDKLYKKTLLINNIDLFNEKVSLGEDFNTNIPIILDARKIVLLPNFTPYHYRYNPKSIVNTINPKSFDNIKELGDACERIKSIKNFNSIYIDSFIGNIIFEEVNRIYNSDFSTRINEQEIREKLDLCNGFYYLNCYSSVRNIRRIFLYNWFIQHKYFKLIKILILLNKLRQRNIVA